MPLCAQTQTTTLNNNGCSCTSYQGAYLPVTNGGTVAYVHMNPFAAPPFFETLDANFTVLQEWTDFVVVHAPSASQPYLNATFNGGKDYTHQTFTPKYYRSGYILVFAGGTSPLQTQ
ncbi:MAG: hypothetical protein DMG82_04035 [Acidobacteria bacterium]|nr:MAG: hypothetical protein DMG82_04035 [Acidobacteriota bacterium]